MIKKKNNVILEKQSTVLLVEVKSIGESSLINIIIISFGKQLPFFLSKRQKTVKKFQILKLLLLLLALYINYIK